MVSLTAKRPGGSGAAPVCGRLVEHDGAEPGRIELVQTLVVGDVDAVAHIIAVQAVGDLHAHRSALGYRLRRNCQRTQDQAVAPGFAVDRVRPSDLHARFPEPGIGEDGAPASPQRPSNQIRLMREKPGIVALGRNARRRRAGQLGGNVGVVVLAHRAGIPVVPPVRFGRCTLASE